MTATSICQTGQYLRKPDGAEDLFRSMRWVSWHFMLRAFLIFSRM
jgi:hypothetical protein